MADGHIGWWESPEGVKVRQRIGAEVRARYRAELRRAGWFKQTLLEFRMRREIVAECEKVASETLWARK